MLMAMPGDTPVASSSSGVDWGKLWDDTAAEEASKTKPAEAGKAEPEKNHDYIAHGWPQATHLRKTAPPHITGTGPNATASRPQNSSTKKIIPASSLLSGVASGSNSTTPFTTPAFGSSSFPSPLPVSPEEPGHPVIGLAALQGKPFLPGKDSAEWIEEHIARMMNLSPDLKERKTLGSTFAVKKSSSEQYQYAKYQLTEAGRSWVAAGLEDVITGRKLAPFGVSGNDALDMWLSVQLARLRTHDPGESVDHAVGTATMLVIGALIPPTAPMLAPTARRAHKNYYRTPERAEYKPAFDGFMKMLRSPDVTDNHKEKIAEALLDQIRNGGTIAPGDQNRIVAALPDGQAGPWGHQTVSKAPAKSNDEAEKKLHRAVIDFANELPPVAGNPDKPVAQAARDAKWRAATSARERIAHWMDKASGNRTDADKKSDFVAHVMANFSKAEDDPIDPTLRHYSATINKRDVVLTVGRDSEGQVDRVYAFQNALNKTPVLKRNLAELRNQGWTIGYGERTRFDADARTVAIGPQDPRRAIESLVTALSNFVDPVDHEKMVEYVDILHEYFRDFDSTGAYNAFTRGTLAAHQQADDGFYNAVKRWLIEGIPPEKLSEEIPGMTLGDAITISLYRNMFTALNAALRGNDEEKKKIVEPLATLIDKALDKLERHEGTVHRMAGGLRIGFFGALSAEDIKRYSDNIGKVITEPAFLSCSTRTSTVYSKDANVHFVIKSKTGKHLRTLSPHDEVLLSRGTPVKVLAVEPISKLQWLKQQVKLKSPVSSAKEALRNETPRYVIYLEEVEKMDKVAGEGKSRR
jgi:hypothetical protein